MTERLRCRVCGFVLEAPAPCPHCGGHLQDSRLAPLLRRSPNPARDYIEGIGLFLAGCRVALGERRLRPWTILPAFLSLVLFVALAATLVWLSWSWPEQLFEEPWAGWLDWLRDILATLLHILLVPIAILVALIGATVLSSVVNSPILDHLSHLTEELAAGLPRAGTERAERAGTSRGIKALLHSLVVPTIEALKLALFEITVTCLLILASLLSGGVVSLALPVAAAYFAALTALDYPMTRKDYRLREKMDFVGRSLAFHLGFGTIPSLLPFLLPLSVVGATRVYLGMPEK
jgi:uncharacterized protein involved in cysteine biosynthesis